MIVMDFQHYNMVEKLLHNDAKILIKKASPENI